MNGVSYVQEHMDETLINIFGAFSLPEHFHRPARQARMGCPGQTG